MKKILLPFLLLVLTAQSYSQRITYIVTTKNDTISGLTLKNSFVFKNELLMNLQEKLVVEDRQGVKKTYYPTDLNSFMLYYDGQKIQYERVSNTLFAQLMYADKVRLYKANTRNFWVFIIKRPNDGKISYMEAKGLSRLISLNEIKRELGDCPDIIQKVEQDVLKVSNLEGIIELAKYYETNCLK